MATEQDFRDAVYDTYRECVSFGYRPSYFMRMVDDLGPLGAAKALLHASTVSAGFVRLVEEHRPDLTVEALALKYPEFFSDEELSVATRRLREVE